MRYSTRNRQSTLLSSCLLLWSAWVLAWASPAPARVQHPIISSDEPSRSISPTLFSSLERMSRLVDISYCVGNTGVSEPFSCVSRCNEFPTLKLSATWNTGMLMSDSCGYIAVDHGRKRPDARDDEDDPMAGKAIIVAFRGTYSITNTVIDLSTVPQEYVPYPSPDDGGEPTNQPAHRCTNCTVHSGFLASWRQARKVVLPQLKSLRERHPGYPVHLVGHSLGGAVAMLAALELRVALGWQDTLVTTFGEPKVGNQQLCDYLDAVFNLLEDEVGQNPENRAYRRVTHTNDPVPLLPLTEWGYRSHGGEFFITKADLSPSIEDVVICYGDHDPSCITQGDSSALMQASAGHHEAPDHNSRARASGVTIETLGFGVPARLKLWQLFFAHRDYFWRIGLCVPGGDPANWGREKYGYDLGGEGGRSSEEL